MPFSLAATLSQLASGRQINTVSNRPLIVPSIIPCAFCHWLLSAPSLSTIPLSTAPYHQRSRPYSLVSLAKACVSTSCATASQEIRPWFLSLLPLIFLPLVPQHDTRHYACSEVVSPRCCGSPARWRTSSGYDILDAYSNAVDG